MGESELIKALHQRGEERIEQLWQEVRDEVERLRQEMDVRVEKARSEIHRHIERVASPKKEAAPSEVSVKARRIDLDAERQLAERCLLLARKELETLASRDRDALLVAFVTELPEAKWQRVTVAPRDLEMAHRHFPGMEVVADQQVGAGFVITTAEDRVVVDSTLETRLQRAWPRLLPQLFAEIRRRINEYESAAKE